MAIPFQKVRYQIMGGVDSKIDGVVLPAPRLQVAENVYSDKTGSLRRRFGRSALSSQDANANAVTGWVATGIHQGRLLGFTNSKVYDYSETLGRWNDRGRCTSWRLKNRPIVAEDSKGVFGTSACDVAVLGNYRCYVYDYYTGTSGTDTCVTSVTLMDANGSRIATKQLATNTAALGPSSGCKVVAFGSRFYVTFWDLVTAGNLQCFIIDTTSAATIASSIAASSTTLAADLRTLVFDTAVNSTFGPFVAYSSTTATTIKWGFINTSGALTGTSSYGAAAGNATHIAVDITGSAAHGIAYAVDATPSDVYALHRSYNGAAWTATASSGAMDTALSDTVAQIACKFDSATVLRVWYSGDTLTTYDCIRQGTYTTANVIASRVAVYPRAFLASRPFSGSDGETYYWITNEPSGGTLQPTLFLVKKDGTLCGYANKGLATLPGFSNFAMPHVATSGDDCITLNRVFVTIDTTAFAGSTGFVGPNTTTNIQELTLSLVHSDSHVLLEDNGVTYIPSSFLQQYDGVGCTEVDFLTFVDSTRLQSATTTSNSTGSLTVAVDYSWMVVPEWTNAQGHREQGTNSGSITKTMGAADDTASLPIDCIPWTLKQGTRSSLRFAIYRTLGGATDDSPFYRVGTIDNNPAADRVTFIDGMSDATAATQEIFRSTDELDPVVPPPGYIVAAGNGRVFVAGLPDDPNMVVYSKLRGHGQALAFNDALQILVPKNTGAVTGLCVMNEALIVFTERSIYRYTGDGLNNTGFGAFSNAQVLVTDQGADGPRGVCLTPLGIMFESSDRMQLLAPSGGVEYIGVQLENLAAPGDVTGICVVPDLMQVRVSYFTTTHVFDYYHRQWYVFTHHSTGPTSLWNGAHAAIDADLVVYDNPAVWTDAGDQYAIDIKLGWQSLPESLQSNLRFQWAGLVGTSLAAARLTVDFYHDFNSTTLSQSEAETISGAGVLRYQWRPNKQVADSLMVRIHDGFLDVYGEYIPVDTAGFRLNEVVFVVGLRERPLRRID